MRKVKLQMQMTLNGFVAGPNGELDWMVWDWDDELNRYVNELTEPVDTILLGRKMADGFVSHWSKVINDPSDPSYAFGKKMIDIPKVVFTRTLTRSEWENTDIATGNLTDEITRLKSQDGQDIIVYGGANFVSNLIRSGLIDEYHLFVNPVALGRGMTIFGDIVAKHNLTLVKAQVFSCGIVVLTYER
jgi:dihydrofolate reductase